MLLSTRADTESAAKQKHRPVKHPPRPYLKTHFTHSPIPVQPNGRIGQHPEHQTHGGLLVAIDPQETGFFDFVATVVRLMMMMTTMTTSAGAATARSAATCDASRGTTPQQFAHPNATRGGRHIDIPTGTGAAHFYATTVTSAARTGHRSTAANYTTNANITITTTITIPITFIDTFVAAAVSIIIVIR